jgi:hypothetical protein
VSTKEGPRSFARFIEALGQGDAHRQISDELFALGNSLQDESLARDVKVKGELTIKLKFVAHPNGMVATDYEVKRKDPTKSTTPGVMWLTKGGNLSSENVRQPELPGIRPAPRAADDDAHEIEGDDDEAVEVHR